MIITKKEMQKIRNAQNKRQVLKVLQKISKRNTKIKNIIYFIALQVFFVLSFLYAINGYSFKF
jgi:hypothetical protein